MSRAAPARTASKPGDFVCVAVAGTTEGVGRRVVASTNGVVTVVGIVVATIVFTVVGVLVTSVVGVVV